jgi:hypothetical protein
MDAPARAAVEVALRDMASVNRVLIVHVHFVIMDKPFRDN